MGVYLYPSGTETELKNAYIWEPYPYEPTEDTLFYYPFVKNQNDIVGNTSISETGTKESIWYKFSKSWTISITNERWLWVRFVSFWLYCNSLPSAYVYVLNTEYWFMQFLPSDPSNPKKFIYVMGTQSSPYSASWYYSSANTVDYTRWNHFAYGIDSDNTFIAAINWSVVWSGTTSWTQYHNSSYPTNLTWGNSTATMTFSDVIWEKKKWTSQWIADYYNKTKSIYWIN